MNGNSLKTITIDQLVPGMFVSQIVGQSGGVKIKSEGKVTSQKVVDVLRARGVKKLVIDPNRAFTVAPPDTPNAEDPEEAFKTTNMIVKSDNSVFTTPAVYQPQPLVAGFSAQELVKMISGSAAIVAQPLGQGVVIGFTDNIHFRGYWYGTDKLMSNALYHSVHLKP